MKLILVVFAAIFIATVYSDDPKKADIEECARENKVDIKVFDNFHLDPNFKATRDMNCFAACVLKKINLIDAEGKYSKQYIETDLAKQCKPEYGKDVCETVGKLMECITKKHVKPNVLGNL